MDEREPERVSPYDLNVGRIDGRVVKDVLEIRQPSIWDKLLGKKIDPQGVAGGGKKVLFLVCGPDP